MKVISMRICPYVQQLRVWLEAKNEQYEVQHIEADNRPAWLYEVSPDGGEVPVLITDDGECLFQSDAIINYVDELYGPRFLEGSVIDRTRQKAWGYLASENYLTQCSTQRSPSEEVLKERLGDLTPIFSEMEKQFGETFFYLGSKLSHVDLSWLPLLHRAALIQKYAGFNFLADYPKLSKWQKNLMNTGLAEQSVPEDFDNLFCDFYLSEETYLGRLARGSSVGV